VNWLLHWLAVHTGTVNEPGPYYGFWSGFGSDLGEVAIVGALAGMLRRHNCHVKRCWRIGRHQVEGTPWLVCARHHPKGAPAHADVLAAATPAAPGNTEGER
jgi:hypothetical protein